MMHNVIELYPSRPAALDYPAVNRRAEARFRAAERRRNLLSAVETIVTGLIGVGFAACLALVFTMF